MMAWLTNGYVIGPDCIAIPYREAQEVSILAEHGPDSTSREAADRPG
jgi:hypothetical protein